MAEVVVERSTLWKMCHGSTGEATLFSSEVVRFGGLTWLMRLCQVLRLPVASPGEGSTRAKDGSLL